MTTATTSKAYFAPAIKCIVKIEFIFENIALYRGRNLFREKKGRKIETRKSLSEIENASAAFN